MKPGFTILPFKADCPHCMAPIEVEVAAGTEQAVLGELLAGGSPGPFVVAAAEHATVCTNRPKEEPK